MRLYTHTERLKSIHSGLAGGGLVVVVFYRKLGLVRHFFYKYVEAELQMETHVSPNGMYGSGGVFD